MSYKIIQIPEKKIAGIQVRTVNLPGRAEKEIAELWNKFRSEKIYEQIPNCVSDAVYGVYYDYELDHTKPYTLMGGCEVSTTKNMPSFLSTHVIPQGTYTEFEVNGPFPIALIEVWQTIWKSPLKRTFDTDFEFYPREFHPETNPAMKVYIAIADS